MEAIDVFELVLYSQPVLQTLIISKEHSAWNTFHELLMQLVIKLFFMGEKIIEPYSKLS